MNKKNDPLNTQLAESIAQRLAKISIENEVLASLICNPRLVPNELVEYLIGIGSSRTELVALSFPYMSKEDVEESVFDVPTLRMIQQYLKAVTDQIMPLIGRYFFESHNFDLAAFVENTDVPSCWLRLIPNEGWYPEFAPLEIDEGMREVDLINMYVNVIKCPDGDFNLEIHGLFSSAVS